MSERDDEASPAGLEPALPEEPQTSVHGQPTPPDATEDEEAD